MAEQTRHARLVLADCQAAIEELADSRQDTMRRRWLAVMSLLRAVGHVLGKIDGQSSSIARRVINAQWKVLNESDQPPIFHGFIEAERNNILKMYQFAIRGNVTIPIPHEWRVGENAIIIDAMPRFDILPLTAGVFAGRDPVEVAREAVAFWRDYLDDIDRRVAEEEE